MELKNLGASLGGGGFWSMLAGVFIGGGMGSMFRSRAAMVVQMSEVERKTLVLRPDFEQLRSFHPDGIKEGAKGIINQCGEKGCVPIAHFTWHDGGAVITAKIAGEVEGQDKK